jgi:hypothetical protein
VYIPFCEETLLHRFVNPINQLSFLIYKHFLTKDIYAVDGFNPCISLLSVGGGADEVAK